MKKYRDADVITAVITAHTRWPHKGSCNCTSKDEAMADMARLRKQSRYIKQRFPGIPGDQWYLCEEIADNFLHEDDLPYC